VDPIERLRRCSGFDWDDWNAGKNWEKHQVSNGECEQAFFNPPSVAMLNHDHADDEDRILLLGKTESGRKLFVVCTIRGDFIRVISARNMTRREREVYFTYG
jgi:hypothetical protein